jgi:tripartite ATP-independent transporter DctP family solute receptor
MTALSGRRAALRKGTSVVAAALLMLLASSPGRAQQHKATLSSILAPNHMITRAYQMFADKVAQKTNGAVAIKVAHSAQLGGIKETADDLIAGNLEFAMINNAAIGALYPRAMLFDLPFVFRDNEHMKKVVRGPIGTQLYQEFADKTGMMVLMAGMADGPRSVWNRVRPIQHPDDLKGMKLRVMESSLMIDTFRALGAVPQPMPFPDVYMAAKQGVIDGAETPPAGLLTMKAPELAKYYSFTNHFSLPVELGMNVRWFKSLSPAHQQAILAAADEARAWYDGEYTKDEQASLAAAKKAGMVINEVADLNEFRKRVKPVYDKYLERVGGQAALDKVQAVR